MDVETMMECLVIACRTGVRYLSLPEYHRLTPAIKRTVWNIFARSIGKKQQQLL